MLTFAMSSVPLKTNRAAYVKVRINYWGYVTLYLFPCNIHPFYEKSFKLHVSTYGA
jgi:hypothetical protein